MTSEVACSASADFDDAVVQATPSSCNVSCIYSRCMVFYCGLGRSSSYDSIPPQVSLPAAPPFPIGLEKSFVSAEVQTSRSCPETCDDAGCCLNGHRECHARLRSHLEAKLKVGDTVRAGGSGLDCSVVECLAGGKVAVNFDRLACTSVVPRAKLTRISDFSAVVAYTDRDRL